jgi:hypothetical protein
LNWKRGFFRLWVLGTALWLAIFLFAEWSSITAPVYPPGVEQPRSHLSPTPPGFPPAREFGPLAKWQQMPIVDPPKEWTPEEFKADSKPSQSWTFEEASKPSSPTAEPATLIVILGRLANIVWRLMIPPAILLAIAWAFAGFAGSKARPSA